MTRRLPPLAAPAVLAVLLPALTGLLPALAAAQPVINSILPAKTSAGTGVTVTVTGTGFGAATDTVRFPGSPYAPRVPISWGPGTVTVVVPGTWSGDVQLRSAASGLLSNPVSHEISFGYQGNKWPGATATWYLNSAGCPDCTFSQTLSAVSSGFGAWTCASSFTYTYGGSTPIASASLDGVSALYWTDTGWADPSYIAVTYTWSDGAGNKLESDIAFNSNFSWSCSGGLGFMDVENVATHEEGHFLGLRDLYGAADYTKTMYGYGSLGITYQRSPQEDDALGAEFMYPRALRPEVAPATPPGWWGPLVPRTTGDATGSFAPLPAALDGGSPTYFNGAMANSGGDCIGPEGYNRIYLDGFSLASIAWTGFHAGPSAAFAATLNSPIWTVRGGRHTLKWAVDDAHDVLESNETNNDLEQQFVWSPLLLADQTPVLQYSPPAPGSLAYPNCDGYAFDALGWCAVGMLPVRNVDDYELRLHDDYIGSTAGFATPLVSSTEPAGRSEFVLMRRTVLPALRRWVGVVRSSGLPADDYRIQMSAPVGLPLVSSATYDTWVTSPVVTLDMDQVLKVHEVEFPDTGLVYTIALDNLSGTADLNLSIYPPGGPYAKTQWAAVSQNGLGYPDSIQFKPTLAGRHAVVVWKRDANDVALANTYQLRVGPALSDLRATLAPFGWTLPLVPRTAGDATLTSVVLPTSLPGNGNTWVNWAIHQQGPNPIGSWVDEGWLDLEDFLGSNTFADPSLAGAYCTINLGPIVIRGGRHTLQAIADPDDLVAESNESDNLESDQFVWSPLPVTRNVPVFRPAPPDPGFFTQPNCDGMQFSHTPGVAWVASLAPMDPKDDYELFLYGDYSGTLSGFSSLLHLSAQPGDFTEFIVGHYLATPTTVYPAAVRFSAEDLTRYFADQTDAVGRRTSGSTLQYLDQELAANRLADVYEGLFSPGQKYHIYLTRTLGTADLAFAVYGTTAGGIWSRSEALAASLVMDDVRDTLTFTATTFGYHPIVVYRTRGQTGLQGVRYTLAWSTTATVGVETLEAPVEIALAGATPNPMRGPGQVEFSLPARARARLEIYDIAGRRVRALLDRELEPGRHVVAWDGTGEDGAWLGAGLYWVRLEAGGRVLTRRVTLLR